VAPPHTAKDFRATLDAVTEGVGTDVVQKWEETPSVTRILGYFTNA